MAMDPEYGPVETHQAPPAGAVPPPHAAAGYTPPSYAMPAAPGLASNVAAGLAYITIIPAIVFLVLEPYKRDWLVRFSSWQCIFLFIASVVLHIGIGLLYAILPGFGVFALQSLLSLAVFALWIIALIQAFQGRAWQIPVIGNLAEQQAGPRPIL